MKLQLEGKTEWQYQRRGKKKKLEKALAVGSWLKKGQGLWGWGICLGPTGLENALWRRGGDLGSVHQRGPEVPPALECGGLAPEPSSLPEAQVGGRNTHCAPSLSSKPPRVPLGVGTPPSPSHPSGHQSRPASTSPPSTLPQHPTWSLGGSSHLLGHWGPNEYF